MAVYYKPGEQKIRPGLYQRYSKQGTSPTAGANDGICAIPVQSSWGPLGKVTTVEKVMDLYTLFGEGPYSTTNTVPAAEAMFTGGANKVHVYRLGTGGTPGSVSLTVQESEAAVAAVEVAAKHPGKYALSVSLQNKLGVQGQKEFKVYHGADLLETFVFAADGGKEPEAICAAVKSDYVTLTQVDGKVGELNSMTAAQGELTGGANPTVTVGDYSKAFAALEPFYYNTIALDVDDDDAVSKSLLLASYLDSAHQTGKLGMAVIGEKSSVAFDTRCQHAKAFNNEKVVYLGNGYVNMAGDQVDGVLAICYTAGVIAATPANQGIVHSVVKGAVDVTEKLTNAQYETAITSGVLLMSVSADGQVWFDSGINTLVTPSADQDEGWKKIRRTKTRFELFDRLDRSLAGKVGKINADPDGVGDVIQTGQRVLALMEDERKLYTGSTFTIDPTLGYAGDSGWFVIETVDMDSLEKIYLHYKFSYAQAAN